MTWKPIETAPKPENDVLDPSRYILGFIPETTDPESVLDPKSQISVVWWEPLIAGGCWYCDADFAVRPTHWQPLPQPPEDE